MKDTRSPKFFEYAAGSLLLITCFTVFGYADTAEPSSAQESTQPIPLIQSEPERTLWTIDTRSASYRRGMPLEKTGIRFLKKVDGCWLDGSCAELGAVDPEMPLIVFFHGMWLDRVGGYKEGMRLYQILEQSHPNRPFQFVIWSWPSMRRQCAPRKDIRIKIARTDTQAFYAAQWIETLPKNRPICMVGYSLGARIVCGSLELLAGGTVGGQSLCQTPKEGEEKIVPSPRRPVRAALIAAAIDNGSFLPCHRNGLVLTQVERLLVTQNSQDRVLRWYPMLYGLGGPEAMGFTGPACRSRLGEDGDRLEVLPVSCSIGRNHYWTNYLRSCTLRHQLLELALEPSVEIIPTD